MPPPSRLLLHLLVPLLASLFAVLMTASIGSSLARAQAGPATPPGAKAPAAEAQAPEKPPPNPIPLSEIPRRGEETGALLEDLRNSLKSDPAMQEVDQQLRALTREIEARLTENRKTVLRTASIETLREVETRWIPLRRNLAGLAREVGRRVAALERELDQLDDLGRTWAVTREEARSSGAPPDLMRTIETTIDAIANTRQTVAAQRSRVLAIQSRLGAQDARVAEALAAVRRTREDLEANAFKRDSPHILSTQLGASAAQSIAAEGRLSLATQWSAVQAYAERQTERFIMQGAVFVALTAALYWSRRRIRVRLLNEPHLSDTAPLFDVPVATALLLTIVGGFMLYPDAPILLRAILGALVLIPTVIILRRLIERSLIPVLYGLVIFYFIDQVRIVVAPLQFLPRLLFLLEMLGAALFAAWLVGFARRRPSRAVPATAGPETDSPGAPAPVQVEPSIMSKIVRRGSYAAFAIAIVAFAANGLGYVALANLLGNTLFVSAYVALMLYAVVQILDALLMLSLHLPPLTLLGAVRRHRGLLRRRLRKFMRWLGVGLWLLFALDHLALRERLFRMVRDALTAELDVGALSISLADVIAFAACVWAAYLVSRFVRFLLEEDVYPRVRLTRGLPYAISTILNYTILVVGFLTGVAALGFDMTKFTILAGAFSIGVGFGLQNIFNNFVSGLILLFERPVKVGDVVEIDGTAGVVDRIGIRASTIRSSNGSEFIVPNGKLISERVVNWTFSSRQRSLQLSISVVIGSDLKQVIAVLERVARNHPMVIDNPPPKALVVRMGPDFLGLELHAWTNEVDRWMEIRSDLAVAAGDALAAEKIAVR